MPCALVALLYICICRSSLNNLAVYHMTFIPLSVFQRNGLSNPVFSGVGLSGFRAWSMLFHWPKRIAPILSSTVFTLSSLYRLVSWGWVFGLII